MAVVALSLLLAAMCCWEAQAIRQMNDAQNVHILAIGDSITEGAVPSLNTNHPYTRRLAQLLRRKFPGSRVSIHNSGMHSLTITHQTCAIARVIVVLFHDLYKWLTMMW